jgi:uncharacterized protein (TIGR02996 family)
VGDGVSLTIDLPSRRTLLAEAVAALEARSFVATDAVCARVLAAHPEDMDALLLRGLALAASGQIVPAARLLNHVGAARTGFAHPCRDLDGLLEADGVATQVRACLDLAPNDARLRLMWADWLQTAGDPHGAAATLVALLDDEPDSAAAHYRLGMVHAELGEFDAAIAQMRRAVALDPVPALGWANLGMLLKIQGSFAESLSAYEQAVRRAPGNAQIRVNRVVALLHAGRFAEAWQDHEWRFALAENAGAGLPLARLLPPLELRPELAGRTVLLTLEAGFGDMLQFARYIKLLAARGARIVLAVPPELQRLLAAMPGVVGTVPMNGKPPAYDWHCPITSLPRIFATTLETIPAEVPYLTADLTLVAAWAARLPARCGLRVGLVWAGQARPWLPGFITVNARRSTSLAQFAPFGAVDGVQFISLQAGAPAAEARRPPPGLALYDPMPLVTDFADTAAIIANLDLVISVDTSVVHLAGALGKPVFLLDRYDNCWRWLSGRTDSPWYPKLRIFRQAQIGDWAPVIRRAAEALAEIAAAVKTDAPT